MNDGLFYIILSVPHNIVMDLNNVLSGWDIVDMCKDCPLMTKIEKYP